MSVNVLKTKIIENLRRLDKDKLREMAIIICSDKAYEDGKMVATRKVEKKFGSLFNQSYENGRIYMFLTNFIERDASMHGDLMMRFYYQSILELMR